MVDDAEVMRDEDVRQTHLLLKLFEKVQDLRLNGHVQRRNGLVADDQLRLHRKSAGNADSLAAAAVEFVGIAVDKALSKTDGVHELEHAVFDLVLVRQDFIEPDGLGNDLVDRLLGVERGIRILEDDLHILAHVPHLGFRELGDILSFKEHLAGGRLNETKNGPARRGLAAAGLADQPQRLAALQVEADVVDRVQHTVTGLEVFFQVPDL